MRDVRGRYSAFKTLDQKRPTEEAADHVILAINCEKISEKGFDKKSSQS